jgi:hypothetical protein
MATLNTLMGCNRNEKNLISIRWRWPIEAIDVKRIRPDSSRRRRVSACPSWRAGAWEISVKYGQCGIIWQHKSHRQNGCAPSHGHALTRLIYTQTALLI